jgi:YesN/AraC family two-component response regulator
LIAQPDVQSFDLVVTDVIMPEMGGKKLVDNIRLTHPRAKILFCSGYTNDALVQHGVLEPSIRFLQKPYSMQALAQKIREVLDQ